MFVYVTSLRNLTQLSTYKCSYSDTLQTYDVINC